MTTFTNQRPRFKIRSFRFGVGNRTDRRSIAAVFTGIVESAVPIANVEDRPGGRRIVLGHRWGDEQHGESVAVNGCCLTVAAILDDGLAFDAIKETLDKTNLGALRAGDRVHVERSLTPTSRIDGHFVQGHVDGRAELVDRVASDAEWRFTLRPPAALMPFVFPKGSVCLDGVSLTVAALASDTFDVALIPTTLQKTAFAERQVIIHQKQSHGCPRSGAGEPAPVVPLH